MNLFKEISIPKPISFLLQLLAFLCHGCYSISAWVCLCHCVWPFVLVWILLRELMCVCRTCETHARFHQTCQSKNTMMIVIHGHTHTYIIYICNISMYLWGLISCNIQKDLKAGPSICESIWGWWQRFYKLNLHRDLVSSSMEPQSLMAPEQLCWGPLQGSQRLKPESSLKNYGLMKLLTSLLVLNGGFWDILRLVDGTRDVEWWRDQVW